MNGLAGYGLQADVEDAPDAGEDFELDGLCNEAGCGELQGVVACGYA